MNVEPGVCEVVNFLIHVATPLGAPIKAPTVVAVGTTGAVAGDPLNGAFTQPSDNLPAITARFALMSETRATGRVARYWATPVRATAKPPR